MKSVSIGILISIFWLKTKWPAVKKRYLMINIQRSWTFEVQYIAILDKPTTFKLMNFGFGNKTNSFWKSFGEMYKRNWGE